VKRSDDRAADSTKDVFIDLGTEAKDVPPDAEASYFRNKYRPPFTATVISGRRLASPTTPLEAIAVGFAFPLFLGRAVVDKEAASVPEWASRLPPALANDPNVMRKLGLRGLLRRRYSGDIHHPLPRGRYFALSGGDGAERSYALSGELNAYAIPLLTGYCAATTLSGRAAVGVVFRGLPGDPNPLRCFVTEPDHYNRLLNGVPSDPRLLITADLEAGVAATNQFIVSIPCDDVDLSIERIFDMRLPATRRWMVDFFRNPPLVHSDDDLAHGECLRILAQGYGVDLTGIDGWRALLPIICGPSHGGNAMTDLFAAFLRRMGCEGIIYPSARSDHGVIFEAGRLVHHWGWHLVDYRGSSLPKSLSFEEVKPLPPWQGLYHHAEIEDGELAGSFAVIGGSLHTRMTLQTQFDRHVLERRMEWRERNGTAALKMRGYCWYRHNYSASQDEVECDACGTRFSYEQVGPRRQCPSCRFGGDLGVFETVPKFLVSRLSQV